MSGLLLLGAVATSDHVEPLSVVLRSRPPAPTSRQVLPLVHAMENMSLFDGNHVRPPSVVRAQKGRPSRPFALDAVRLTEP